MCHVAATLPGERLPLRAKSLPSLTVLLLASLTLLCAQTYAQVTVTISSPANGSTSISAVAFNITASSYPTFSHMEIYDNGVKLGDVFSNTVAPPNNVYVLPKGSHTLTIYAVTSGGAILGSATSDYTVGEQCQTSSTVQCDMDQQAIDPSQFLPYDCPQQPSGTSDLWVGITCPGVQGSGGNYPTSFSLQASKETGSIPDQGNTTLNGQSLYLSEMQASGGYSNVLFQAFSPNHPTTPLATTWKMDEYVYLNQNLNAYQAVELDTNYVNMDADGDPGVWTKFFTQCAFVYNGGPGYWAVVHDGTWLYLNGVEQNGITPPVVPCNRSSWAQPWIDSASNWNGWHHIVWNFTRNNDGSTTYNSLTFDGTTYTLNLSTTGDAGTGESNNGYFAPNVQLDGVGNSETYPTVSAYVNELNITHTP